jgi:hypothetical protein
MRMPKKFDMHHCQKVPFGPQLFLSLGCASAAPRLENPDSDKKDALFGLDTQLTILELLQ